MDSASRRSEDLRRLLRAALTSRQVGEVTYAKRGACILDDDTWAIVVRLVEGATVREVSAATQMDVGTIYKKLEAAHRQNFCGSTAELMLRFAKTYLGALYCRTVGKKIHDMLCVWVLGESPHAVAIQDPRPLLRAWVGIGLDRGSEGAEGRRYQLSELGGGSVLKDLPEILGISQQSSYMPWFLCRLAADYEWRTKGRLSESKLLFVEAPPPVVRSLPQTRALRIIPAATADKRLADIVRLLTAKLPKGSLVPTVYIDHKECRLANTGWSAIVGLIEGKTMEEIAQEIGLASDESVRNALIKEAGYNGCEAIPPLILLFIKTYLGLEYAAVVGKEAYHQLSDWLKTSLPRGEFDPRPLLSRWVDASNISSVESFLGTIDVPVGDIRDAWASLGSRPKAALGLTGKSKYMVWVLCRLAAEYERALGEWPDGYLHIFTEGDEPPPAPPPSPLPPPSRRYDVMRLRFAVLGPAGANRPEVAWDVSDELWLVTVGLMEGRSIKGVAADRRLKSTTLAQRFGKLVTNTGCVDTPDFLIWFMRTQLGYDYADKVARDTHEGIRTTVSSRVQVARMCTLMRLWVDPANKDTPSHELAAQAKLPKTWGHNLPQILHRDLGYKGGRFILMAVCRLAAAYERKLVDEEKWPGAFLRVFTSRG